MSFESRAARNKPAKKPVPGPAGGSRRSLAVAAGVAGLLLLGVIFARFVLNDRGADRPALNDAASVTDGERTGTKDHWLNSDTFGAQASRNDGADGFGSLFLPPDYSGGSGERTGEIAKADGMQPVASGWGSRARRTASRNQQAGAGGGSAQTRALASQRRATKPASQTDDTDDEFQLWQWDEYAFDAWWNEEDEPEPTVNAKETNNQLSQEERDFEAWWNSED